MIDLLVIKKKPEATIKNEIGKKFRKYNIFEYKSIADALNLDVFVKAIGYACFLKVHGMDGEKILLSDITITFVRKSKPIKLLKELKKLGISCQRESQGIYRLDGFALFPIQIIVTKELDMKEHMWLTALNGTMEREEAERLVKRVEKLEAHDREYANAVLQIAMKRNTNLFEKMKEEMNMNYVLELFKPEIEAKMKEERVEGREEGRVEGQKILYQTVQRLRKGETVEELMKSGIDVESVRLAQILL